MNYSPAQDFAEGDIVAVGKSRSAAKWRVEAVEHVHGFGYRLLVSSVKNKRQMHRWVEEVRLVSRPGVE